jgi:hypothetical protein
MLADWEGMIGIGHSPGRYALISALPALLPAGTFLFLLWTEAALRIRDAWRRALLLAVCLFSAGNLVVGLQYLLGGLRFPPVAARPMYRDSALIRSFDIYKDTALVYPALLSLFALMPMLAYRSGLLAHHARKAGRVADPSWDARQRWAWRFPTLRRSMRSSTAILFSVNLYALSTDIVENVGRRNYPLVAHMAFQVIVPVIIGMIVFYAVSDATGDQDG